VAATSLAAHSSLVRVSLIAAQITHGIGLEGNYPLYDSLSNREFKIMRMLVSGKPVAENEGLLE